MSVVASRLRVTNMMILSSLVDLSMEGRLCDAPGDPDASIDVPDSLRAHQVAILVAYVEDPVEYLRRCLSCSPCPTSTR